MVRTAGGSSDSERGSEGQIKVPNPTTRERDEDFEWGEVRRGMYIRFLESMDRNDGCVSVNSGLSDFQTWVTGSAFFANIVAIYSYSLFL